MIMKNKSGLPLNVGIAGCGGVAQVIHLPILTKHSDVRIQAICDIDAPKAAVVADKFKIPRVYEDIEEMVIKEQLDVIFILTPNNMHLPMSLLALKNGIHVFIEKPAARNLSAVKRIQEKAVKEELTVMVGMQNRFRTDIQALHKFIQGEELGRLFSIKARWLHAKHQAVKQPWLFNKNVSGGGVIMDLGVQLIDMVWWLLDKPKPSSVKSFIFNINQNLKVEDFCMSCIHFENDISFMAEMSWDFPIPEDQFSLEIAGEQGTGTLNPLKLQKMMHGQIVNITPEIKETKISNFKSGYQNEVNHFIDYLLGRTNVLESTIEDSIVIFSIINAIYKSISTGDEIKL